MRKIFIAIMVLGLVVVVSKRAFSENPVSTELDAYVCPIEKVKFDDGDSFKCDGVDIRVLGVDTPEITHKEHGILKNQEMGREAAAFTKKALRSANRILIIKGGKGHYGRTLAHVMLDGELLSVMLIKSGLGYETISKYGDNGFPLYASVIVEAFKSVPKPKFENPSIWRAKNQQKPSSSIVKR
jgi:endonuclease YncB( thermonuclease family)